MAADGDAIDEVLHKLDEWCRAYPESVFPEPTKEDFDAVNSVFPNAVTRISASMGRHMVMHMREMADAIRTAAPQAQGEGMTPQEPAMGVSDEAQREAPGAVACYRLVRSVFRTAWLDGDVCAEDEAKLRDATFTVERAYTTAPVDVRVEALRNRFLSDTSSLPEEWQDWREDFRRDIQALLDGQPSADAGEFQPVGYVTEEGANYYAENFGTVSLKPKNGTEIFAAIAAQREASSA